MIHNYVLLVGEDVMICLNLTLKRDNGKAGTKKVSEWFYTKIAANR